MGLTYTTYVATIANLMVTDPTNTEFIQILPSIIDYAEQRLYRELDPLATVVQDTSGTLLANQRLFTLPNALGTFVVVEEINIFTPSGTTSNNGTRVCLMPVSRDYVDIAWPSTTATNATDYPTVFGMVTDQTAIVGPPPGAVFNVEVVGTIRPVALSATNPTTYLTLYCPQLFVAGSMVFASGFMRNFGSQADDPKMAASWEDQYNKLFASAMSEMGRQRGAGPAWTQKSVAPIATPPRA